MRASFLSTLTVLGLSLMATGCASLAVSDAAITDRTASALGLGKGDFTISERRDEGTSTRYVARTKAGQEYNCTIGGSFNVLGRVVSDALCNKKGEVARNPLLR